MNEKVAAGKLFSEDTNAERVNRFWRGSMKRRVMSFLLSLILIMTSTVVVVPAEVEAATTVVKNFEYTGRAQSFVATQTGTYTLEVWGAQGGTAYGSYVGGKGGYSKGTVTLQLGDTLYIYVGGKGTDTGTSSSTSLKAGGFNGGGKGAISYYSPDSGTAGYSWGGGGGGGTDIRINQDSLYARVIVAGGGSGGARSSLGGTTNGYVGGGTQSGGLNSTYWATQTKAGSGGTFGTGKSIDSSNWVYVSGGGGGGWYGGGASRNDSSSVINNMGGGSGYIYTSSTASSYPSGCLLNSSYYLTDTTIADGATSFVATDGGTETGHSGNGYARITYTKAENTVSGNTVLNFEYTGQAELFIVPETGDYTIEAWGAQGGTGYNSAGGKGGYARGTVHLEQYQMIYIYVGGKGTDTGTSSSTSIKSGGFNGGGNGTISYYAPSDGSAGYSWGGGGGGASDVRIGDTSLYARVIVAGGGSGGARSSLGGSTNGYVGGGTQSGGLNSSYWATQTKAGSGGAFGLGKSIASSNFVYSSGGGGGGWYGGGASQSDNTSVITYMGGGSGYVYTSSTATNYPSGCLLNSSYYMTDAYTINGYAEIDAPDGTTETGHSGNGHIKITYTKTLKDPTYEATDFSYTGAVQEYTVPATGDYLLEVWGAQGGTAYNTSYQGGKGGYSRGIVKLTAGTKLYIYVGGQGKATGTSSTVGTLSGAGFNGGGKGVITAYSGTTTWSAPGGGGSDIRIAQDSLYARVIAAGGGSGGTRTSDGHTGSKGYGGGTTSGAGGTSYQATQTKAGTKGSFGQGANATTSTNYKYASPGAGGGWYGGGCGTQSDTDTSILNYSGGGSGYVYTSDTASSYPSGCLLNSTYYLSAAYTIAGNTSFDSPTAGTKETGHAGNGYAKISRVIYDEVPPTVTFGTDGSTTYVAKASTKVTVGDESGIDESSLKYQWTQSTTAPAASTFTETFANGETITFSGQGGTWYLWILAADTIGNTSIISSKSFIIDCIAPSGTISIVGKLEKNGYKYTNDKTLTINLTTTDDISSTSKIRMALINENDFSLSNSNSEIQWMNFSATKTWTPSSGDGLKTIYVIFKDEAGNQSIYLANSGYRVIYNANGGTGAPATQTKFENENLILSSVIPTKENKKFVGWATSSTATSATYQPGDVITVNMSLTLYAVWKDAITITFDPNGGNVDITSKDVEILGTYGTLPTPTLSGATFDGWYTSANGGTKVTENTPLTQSTDHTLFARWIYPTLYSVANVGDYVNYPVTYKNVSSGSGGGTATLTGWRVISKDSSTGRVNLISAGLPLSASVNSSNIPALKSNILSLTMITNGFDTQDLSAAFDNVYTHKNGSTPQVRTILSSEFSNGVSLSTTYTEDLYKINAIYHVADYYLSDSSSEYVWSMQAEGNFRGRSGQGGIRPVVTLNENVKAGLTKTNNAWDITM